MDNITNQPQPVHKTNWMVIILLIVIVAIVALGIWWWTQDTAKIAGLEQQVAQSEVKTNGTTVTPTATPTPNVTAQDTRTLITMDNQGEYCGDNSIRCREQNWSNAAPTTTSQYHNANRGIDVELPFNPDWGSEKYRISPYEDPKMFTDTDVFFGPMGYGEGGLWRMDSLRFLEAKSVEVVLVEANQAIDKTNTMEGANLPRAEKATVNNLTVVKYESSGMTDTSRMIVIGQKFNYEFEYPSGSTAHTWNELEKIVSTVKLI